MGPEVANGRVRAGTCRSRGPKGRRAWDALWRDADGRHQKRLGPAHVRDSGRRTHEALRHRHSSVLAALEPLIERGQADGSFRADVPAAWHLSMVMALIHAASGELGAGRVSDDEAEPAVVATILGAVRAPRAAR